MTFRIEHHHFAHDDNGTVKELCGILTEILTIVDQQGKDIKTIMAGVTDVNSSETTLHADLVAENGLIKQLLTAFAGGNLTSAQAQALVDSMNADDADAKGNIAAITAVLPAPATPAAT